MDTIKLKLNSLDIYSGLIDTYGVLDPENVISDEIDYYLSEYDEYEGYTVDDFENIMTFNYSEYVKDLAVQAIDTLDDFFIWHKGYKFLTNFKLDSYSSPKEYNYTTDSIVFTVDCGKQFLDSYYLNNTDEVNERLSKLLGFNGYQQFIKDNIFTTDVYECIFLAWLDIDNIIDDDAEYYMIMSQYYIMHESVSDALSFDFDSLKKQ